MSKPVQSSATQDYYDYNEYAEVMLQADPETEDLAAIPTAQNEKIRKEGAVRTLARKKMNQASARRDLAFRGVMKAIDAFERDARKEFKEGVQSTGYKSYFKHTPAQLGRLAVEDRPKVFKDLVTRMTFADVPKALEKPGKAVAAAWAEYEAMANAHDTAVTTHHKARESEELAKAECLIALTRLEGKLKDRFPNDEPRRRSYFPPTRSKVTDEQRIERAAKRAKKEEEKRKKAQAAADKIAARAQAIADKAAAKAKAAAEKAALLAKSKVPAPGPVATGAAPNPPPNTTPVTLDTTSPAPAASPREQPSK